MTPPTSTLAPPAKQQPIQTARQRLTDLFRSESTSTDTITEVIEIAVELTNALGVIYLRRDAEQRLAIAPQHFAPANLSHLQSIMQQALRLGNVAAAENSPQGGIAVSDANLLLAAVPVARANQDSNDALVIVKSVESTEQKRATTAYLVQILSWIAATIASQQSREDTDSAGSITDLQDLRSLLSRDERTSYTDHYRSIATWINQTTHSDETLIAWRVRGRCRIIAHTGSDSFNSRSERINAAEEHGDEILSGAEQGVPEELLDGTSAATTLSQVAGKQLRQRYVLRDQFGKPQGVALCLAKQDRTVQPIAEAMVQFVGCQIGLLRTAEPGLLKLKLKKGLSSRGGLRHPTFLAGLAAIGLLLILPVSLRVKAPCVVQPKQRRFVAVPYEGRLETALTNPGDVVQAGQILATMDARELHWQLSSVIADLRRAEKNRDAALAESLTSKAQIAGLEAKRLELQIHELEDQLDKLEVRSPIDGVVVNGDPARLEGARFSVGDTLLEIAPLSNMLVELEVADEDISHVRIGQTVSYRLAASPLNTLTGSITTIRPRSEMRENRNVFVAHVELDNPNDQLHPGMRGWAKITCDKHPLGWNLFHKAWEHAANWFAW